MTGDTKDCAAPAATRLAIVDDQQMVLSAFKPGSGKQTRASRSSSHAKLAELISHPAFPVDVVLLISI